MRRPIVLCLVACAAAAAALALGSALGAQTDDAAPAGHAAHLTAARSPLAGLDARFRKLAPAGACAAGAPKARPARRLRAAALKGAAKAPPKVLRRKKASMRRAIGLMRAAGDLCEAAQGGGAPPPGGGAPPAGPPPPAPGGPPGPPPPQEITLHVTGPDTMYVETSAAAAPGAMRLTIVNTSALSHFAGVRLGPGNPVITETPQAAAGQTQSVNATIGPGTYEIYCRQGNHYAMGMHIPFMVG